jgi:hypothetical protein
MAILDFKLIIRILLDSNHILGSQEYVQLLKFMCMPLLCRKYWLETIGGWLKGMMSDVLIVCFGCHSNKGCCHVEQKFKLDVLCCGFGP